MYKKSSFIVKENQNKLKIRSPQILNRVDKFATYINEFLNCLI